MSKKLIIKLISDALKQSLLLSTLKLVRRALDSGELGNVFSDAVDKAIETKEAEIFQKNALP